MKLRTKETFFEHIDVKDSKTVDSYKMRIVIFEKYCNERFGKEETMDELQEDWL